MLPDFAFKSKRTFHLLPSFFDERPFFFVLHVKVDSGRRRISVAHPALDEAQRNLHHRPAHPEAVTQPFCRRMDADDFRGLHDSFDDAPASRAREGPQWFALIVWRDLK